MKPFFSHKITFVLLMLFPLSFLHADPALCQRLEKVNDDLAFSSDAGRTSSLEDEEIASNQSCPTPPKKKGSVSTGSCQPNEIKKNCRPPLLPEKYDDPIFSPCRDDVENVKEERVIVEKMKGILLVGCEEAIRQKEALKHVTGIQVDPGLDMPSSVNTLKQKLTLLYLDQPLSLKIIKQIKKEILNFYVEQGYPFTIVIVPKQCISTGVLQLIISEAKIDRVVMEGNHYAMNDLCHIRKYFHVYPGERINATRIQKEIDFVNRNPYRHVNALYAPGKDPGTTDLIIPVEERKPWRLYAGADNTGLVRIRRQRLFSGLGINHFMGFDNYLNFQYTTAYEPHVFQSYTGQWMIFFPWKHALNIYGGYSRIHSDLPFPEMSNTGIFYQASGRYCMPFQFGPRVPFELTVGFDFKRTNTTLLFSEAAFPNTSSAANLSQFVFDFRIGYNGDYTRLEIVAELYYSPPQLLPDETSADYNNLRPGASPYYIYGKGAIRYTQWLPMNFESIFWLRGQLSSDPILPSEQYGLGGHDTVRGYDEYQLTMDNAANINYELRTPGIPIISQIRRWKIKDALQFLVFVDYGIGKNKNLFPGEHSPSWLLGIGPGARYTLDPNIALRFDWGWKMVKKPDGPGAIPYTGGPSEVHFSGTLSY